MYVYLDDIRDPVGDDWVVVRTVQQAIILLKTGGVTMISLDHDLGENQPTGYDLIKWMEEAVVNESWTPPAVIWIHSANPVGVKNMTAGIQAIRNRTGEYVG